MNKVDEFISQINAVYKKIRALTPRPTTGLRRASIYHSPNALVPIHREILNIFISYGVRRSYQIKLEDLESTLSKLSPANTLRSLASVSDLPIFGEVLEEYKSFLLKLIECAENKPDSLFNKSIVEEKISNTEKKKANNSNKSIFIIHGHDELNRLRLEKILRDRFKLDVIIMMEKPKKGRTLIDKFEQEAQQASYAFALFSPDDFTITEKEEYYEARPNVIFELGWFYSHLGREKVAIILKEGTKIPTDLDGIDRFQFRETVEEEITRIELELKEAGIID